MSAPWPNLSALVSEEDVYRAASAEWIKLFNRICPRPDWERLELLSRQLVAYEHRFDPGKLSLFVRPT